MDAGQTRADGAPPEVGKTATSITSFSADLPVESNLESRPGHPEASATSPWSRRFSGASFENGYSRRLDLLVDPSNNVFVVGDFKGSIDLGGGKLTSAGKGDILVAKFDAAGRPLWSKRFGDATDQIYSGAALDREGNLVITGVFNGSLDFGDGALKANYLDMFLAKLDPDGKPLWSKRFGGSETTQWASAVAVGPDNEVILTGHQEGTLDYGGLSLRTHGLFIFVMKFDYCARPIWGKTFSGSTDQDPIAVAVDPGGDVVLGGNAKRAEIDGVKLAGKGMMDVMVARWSSGGELRWAGIFGDPDDQLLSTMSLGPDGDVILGGTFRGTIDFRGAPLSTSAPSSYEFFLARLDRNGRAVFSQSFPTGGAVAVDTLGNIVIAGSFEGRMKIGRTLLNSAGGKDVFVTRLLPSGEQATSFRAGDGKDQRATAVALDRNGRPIILGVFDGSLNLGSGTLLSESGRDLFLAKLAR